jgi:NAD(P)-dependent dehydrogenase (short-subunit alcohol dehydrogenase family)
MGKLGGQVAIVTGAGSGIGRASAKLFAVEGAKVLAADVTAVVAECSVAPELGRALAERLSAQRLSSMWYTPRASDRVSSVAVWLLPSHEMA